MNIHRVVQFLMMLQVRTYYIILLLYQLRSLNCAYVLYYTGSACMRCFIPFLLPALQASPPGEESQTPAAGSDEGDCHMTSNASRCEEEEASHIYVHSYIHVFW